MVPLVMADVLTQSRKTLLLKIYLIQNKHSLILNFNNRTRIGVLALGTRTF